MTLRASKPAFNVREKLTELGRRFGLKGSELVAAETVQEARDLVSAGRKNFVINGSMMIYQRGAGSTSTTGYYGPDRQRYMINYGTYSITRSTGAPSEAGFAFSSKIDCTTAGTPTAGQHLTHRISPLEGYDSEKFAYGTSGAKTSTVSFWIKCSYADTFALAIVCHDNQRSCFRSFTINQANTWEYKTLTFPGDTSGNGADNDNTLGLTLDLFIGGGTNFRGSSAPEGQWNTRPNNQDSYLTKNSTSFGTSTSHTMNITGVQWEFGPNATDFEHRSYGEELALCKRYYQRWNGNDPDFNTYDSGGNRQGATSVARATLIAHGHVHDSDDANVSMMLDVEMRDNPTVDLPSGNNSIRLMVGPNIYDNATYVQENNCSRNILSIFVDNGGAMTANQPASLILRDANSYLALDAEI